MFERWSDFRRRQREILRASNASTPIAESAGAAEDGGAEDGMTPSEEQGKSTPLEGTLPLEHQKPAHEGRDYGSAGRPLNRQSPFYVGFVGALGVLVAYGLFRVLGQLTQVITLLVIAFVLALALNPLVETLNRRGLARPLSVAIVFVGLVAVFTALGFVVVPPVACSATRSSRTSTASMASSKGSRPSSRSWSPTATS